MNSEKVILLIEDNPSDVELTKRALDKGRIANKLVVAEDGEEALDYIWGRGGHTGRDIGNLPALVLLDLKLPKVSGLEVLRRVRADRQIRRMPIVILTSSREEQDVAASYDLGVNSYIRKPVDFKQFALCIEQLGLYWLVLNEPAPKVMVEMQASDGNVLYSRQPDSLHSADPGCPGETEAEVRHGAPGEASSTAGAVRRGTFA